MFGLTYLQQISDANLKAKFRTSGAGLTSVTPGWNRSASTRNPRFSTTGMSRWISA